MSKRSVIYAEVKLDHSANYNLLGSCRHVMGEVQRAFVRLRYVDDLVWEYLTLQGRPHEKTPGSHLSQRVESTVP